MNCTSQQRTHSVYICIQNAKLVSQDNNMMTKYVRLSSPLQCPAAVVTIVTPRTSLLVAPWAWSDAWGHSLSPQPVSCGRGASGSRSPSYQRFITDRERNIIKAHLNKLHKLSGTNPITVLSRCKGLNHYCTHTQYSSYEQSCQSVTSHWVAVQNAAWAWRSHHG